MPFLHPIFIIAILIALSVHEWAHAFAANRLGDPTAEQQGRLTLNPIAHLDPLGTLLFLLIGFGWGKPVPIDPRYFRRPRRDAAIVALAGPLSNFFLAALCFTVLVVMAPRGVAASVWGLLDFSLQGPLLRAFTWQLLSSSLFLNLGLMAFNLLPVAPLDGSKILGAVIPARYDDPYEQFLQWGPWILLFLLLGERLLGMTLLADWIGGMMNAVLGAFQTVAALVV
ncbi:MAG: peptidase M50 [Candidatus Peregrinibacteria bacterium Greene0416_19]|nr:MAG: peptidase M50 [Candidatus Peregrinibacteria bacterium Greene0416_19]